MKRDAALLCPWADVFDVFLADDIELAFLEFDLVLGIRLGQLQQGFDEAVHTLGTAAGHLDGFLIRCRFTLAGECELGLCEDD